MLARTSNDDKYDGLTYFIVPIAGAKGVTVRPLIKITGETGFNEVLFEDVVVPDTLRVDEVGKGWTVAMTTLLYERGAAEGAGSGGGASLEERIAGADRVWRSARTRNGKPAWDDRGHPRPRRAARDPRRGLAPDRPARARRGAHRPPDAPPAAGEAAVSELMQDIAAVALEIEGPARDPLPRRSRARPTAATGRSPTELVRHHDRRRHATRSNATSSASASSAWRSRSRTEHDDGPAQGFRFRRGRADAARLGAQVPDATTRRSRSCARWSRATITRPTRATSAGARGTRRPVAADGRARLDGARGARSRRAAPA